MNILPSIQPGPQPLPPQQGLGQVQAVRPLENPGGRAVPQRAPQGTPAQRDAVAERLEPAPEPDTALSRTARRAVSAYTSHGQDEERQYMRQILGFEIRI